jgi:signal transduction histidine kinase/plastocyanin
MAWRPRVNVLVFIVGALGVYLVLIGSRGGPRGIAVLLVILLSGLGVAILWRMVAHRMGERGRQGVRRLVNLAYLLFFVLYASFAVAFLLAGLAPAVARAVPQLHDALHRWGGGEGATVRLVARDNAFDRVDLSLPSEGEVAIEFTNTDIAVLHNVAIYRRGATAPVFAGELIGGTASIRYQFRAPPEGFYAFACEVHPQMRGVVRFAPQALPAPGSSNVFSRLAGRVAAASHGSELAAETTGQTVVAAGQVVANYVFSALNVILALALMRLRWQDRVARLLALGMLGTAAVFNAQAHVAFEVIPGGPTEFAHESFHLISGSAYMLGLLLFPDGRLFPRAAARSWLWIPVEVAVVVFVLLFGAGFVLGFHGTDAGGYVAFFGLAIPIAGLASQLFRKRRATTGEQRQQSRVLVWALGLALGGTILFGVIIALLAAIQGGQTTEDLDRTIFLVFPALFAVIPLMIVVVLVRYRLWDVERVLSKALVYGVLAAFITSVYVAIVVGIGDAVGSGAEPNLGLSILATALVAVAFEPLRTRLQRLANVLVYGRRASPYEILADFSTWMAASVSIEDVLPRMAEAAARGVGAERSKVTLLLPRGGTSEVGWPPGAPDAPFDRTIEVDHQGEAVGRIAVAKPRGDPLTTAEDELLVNLAAQAGLAMRNVRLTAELQARLEEISRQAAQLRASRQRIVAAQDAAARRLERNIHDGAQQQLVAIAVTARMARNVATEDPQKAGELLDGLERLAQETVEDLRDLARGIYPPLLSDRGLAAALRAQVGKGSVPVDVDSDGIGRYSQEIEAAAYFCCLEALQNVAKYANASRAIVRLHERDGTLVFEVEDDGSGFDVSATAHGSGLQNMTDRVAALGGGVEIDSRPGMGTTVVGRIPARRLPSPP